MRKSQLGKGLSCCLRWLATACLLAGAASFALAATYTLTVNKLGTGSGNVVSNSGNINCGALCSALIASGTNVTLTATADSGSTFAGWSGGCSGTGTCTVSMNQAQSVTASFSVSASSYVLTVIKSGTGTGTVVSPFDPVLSPYPINCGSVCASIYGNGTSVTLTATADSGSTFAGWSGGCSGTGICTVTMSQAVNVTATFTASSVGYTLSVTKSGSGTVVSNPSGINCGAICVTTTFASGASVTLTATPDSGTAFAGWGGDCSGTSATCTVTMNQVRVASATFATARYALSVAPTGTGSGTVASNPSGLNCGTSCSVYFDSGTSVILTATAATGSTFNGWGGACSGTAATCAVTMSQALSVAATFTSGAPANAPGQYDGIYQWSTGNYLSIHQRGGRIIATIYFNADGSFAFPSSDGHLLPVPQLDIFDLLNGPITGNIAKITGTRFHRACNEAHDFVFDDSGNITVTKTGVSNTAAADLAGISCAAITDPIGTVLIVPKILF